MKATILLVVGFVVSAVGAALSASLPIFPLYADVSNAPIPAALIVFLSDALPIAGAVLFGLGVLFLAIRRPLPSASRTVLVVGIAVIVVTVTLLLVAPPTSIWFPELHASRIPFETQLGISAFVTAMTPIGLTLIATAIALRGISRARQPSV